MAKPRIETTAKVVPQCYAYTTPGIPAHDGWTKIGFTERDVEKRVWEQTHTAGIKPKIWWHLLARYISEPMDSFTDKDFHKYLTKLGIRRQEGTEWFQIDPNKAKNDYHDFLDNHGKVSGKGDTVVSYTLREEQEKAVEKTLRYFYSHEHGEFLWNAKPRFGKTLTAYELCKRLNASAILIVTNRPAVATSWYSDYKTFLGLESGYSFVSTNDNLEGKEEVVDRATALSRMINQSEEFKGYIEFVSLQDLKGSRYFGGIYDKLSEIKNVRELLNFFPVYGEDDQGSMVKLDAESVLTIPRHIHAKEVVERGFMSNFLFANISAIFNNVERLNHIFAKQVYGCAPTKIIYQICMHYILGFDDRIHIEKNNFRLCDTLELAKKGTLREKLLEMYDNLKTEEDKQFYPIEDAE